MNNNGFCSNMSSTISIDKDNNYCSTDGVGTTSGCSYNSSQAAAQSIVKKVDNYEKVTNDDLYELGCCIKSSNTSHFPQLSRSFWSYFNNSNNINISSSLLAAAAVVSYVGMVQDILDPEYYAEETLLVSSSSTTTICTKYRDSILITSDDDYMKEDEEHELLGMRDLALLVPLPFLSPWLTPTIYHRTTNHGNITKRLMMIDDVTNPYHHVDNVSYDSIHNTTATAMATATRRMRLDNDYIFSSSIQDPPSKQHDSTTTTPISSTTDSWWPPGHMQSDERYSPILVKLYDRHHDNRHHPPRLCVNDIVRVTGIIWQCDEHEMLLSSCCSDQLLVPKLHALHYEHLYLENIVLAAKTNNNSNNTNNHNTNNNNATTDISSNMDDRSFCIYTLSNHLFQGDEIMAEVLLLSLLSKAERDPKHSNTVKRPNNNNGVSSSLTLLGCMSLNIVLTNIMAEQQQQQQQQQSMFFENLSQTLYQILPIVATIPSLSMSMLSNDKNNEDNNCTSNTFVLPQKKIDSSTTSTMDEDYENQESTNLCRMVPSLLQLPSSSALLINDEINNGRSSSSAQNLTPNGEKVLSSLSSIAQKQTLPVHFDIYDLEFDADYITIVVSHEKKSVLHCNLVAVTTAGKTVTTTATTTRLPEKCAKRIRDYLAKCRMPKSVQLSTQVCGRVEKDFVERRRCCRSVEEEDLHQWLMLTRLQARSRYHSHGNNNDDDDDNNNAVVNIISAQEKDWNAALGLNDAILINNKRIV